MWWALRKLRVDEWLVRVIQAMYEGVSTAVKLGEEESVAFPVRVGGTPGICAKSCAIYYSTGSIVNRVQSGLPWELLYAVDLVLIVESEEKVIDKLRLW